MSEALLALIDALAAAEVRDYLTAKPAPGNDPAPERSNPPASDTERKAA